MRGAMLPTPCGAMLPTPLRRRNHLFIELEEFSGKKWKETGRWNHALEEEVDVTKDGAQAWSRPHLPTVSFHALVHLRTALSKTNVLLDVPGSSFIEVVDHVLSHLVADGNLKEEDAPKVREALQGLTAGGARSPSKSSPLKSPILPASMSPKMPSPARPPQPPEADGGDATSTTRTRLAVLPSASRDVMPSLSLPPAGKTAATPPQSPGERPAVLGLPDSPSGDSTKKDWYRMLEPEADEEALDLLIAHVAFVETPVMAFVRCVQSIDAGCESHAPVRYLFLLIGPESQMLRSTQMAHALAGVMLDEPFVAAVADSADAEGFLRVFDQHLSSIAILPHVHVPHIHNPAGGASPSAAPSAALAAHAAHGGHHHHSAAASSVHSSSEHESIESDDDEDEVIRGDLEDLLRSTKGMPPVRRDGSLPHGAAPHAARQASKTRPDLSIATPNATPNATPSTERRASRGAELTIDVGGAPLHFEGGASDALSPRDDAPAAAHPATSAALVPAAAADEIALSTAEQGPHEQGLGRHLRMFIELEQCIHGQWLETHHWNWAFEQEASGGGGWSAPHLPTVSARALVQLYEGLTGANVLLDAPGTTLPEVATTLTAAFVRTGHLDANRQSRATEILCSRLGSTLKMAQPNTPQARPRPRPALPPRSPF